MFLVVANVICFIYCLAHVILSPDGVGWYTYIVFVTAPIAIGAHYLGKATKND